LLIAIILTILPESSTEIYVMNGV